MDRITANTGNAPIKKLGQTKGSDYGTNSRTTSANHNVSDESNGKASR
jgi:hypothetical protein